jgi:hypothetical protein
MYLDHHDLPGFAGRSKAESPPGPCSPGPGLVVLTPIRQDSGEAVGRAQGVGVVVAQDSAAGEGVCSAVSSSSRPVNTGLRAGTFHTRPTGSSSDRACSRSCNAADSAIEMTCSWTGAGPVIKAFAFGAYSDWGWSGPAVTVAGVRTSVSGVGH